MAPAAGGGKAAGWLRGAADEALVDFVKHSQRAAYKGAEGRGWAAYIQSLPAALRHSDPSRHQRQQLIAFLDGVCAEPEQGAGLERYAAWRAAVKEEEAAAAPGAAANAAAAAAGGPGAAAWRLVERTRAHPKFARTYNFPSWEKGWIRTSRLRPASAAGAAAGGAAADSQKKRKRRKGQEEGPQQQQQQQQADGKGQQQEGQRQEGAAAPRLLGLDCEMCATSKGSNELLSLAVVDEAGVVVIKELVKPKGKVLDLRTSITGITEADLEGVTARRKDVAARLAALLGPDVILVGHSLSADLAALKLDHQPVIDTALLYSYKGLSQATPSLVHLAQQLLGQTLRAGGGGAGGGAQDGAQNGGGPEGEGRPAKKARKAAAAAAAAAAGDGVHDSREDAAAAMALVLHEMGREAAGAPTAPLDPPAVKVPKEDLCKLLVHSIPATLASPQLAITHAFGAARAPPPAAVEPGGAPRQLLLVFADVAAANAAFNALPGPRGADSLGRHQKDLVLAGGVKVRVRKMACHAGAAFGKDAPKDRGEKRQQPGPKAKAKKARKQQQAQQQQRAQQQQGQQQQEQAQGAKGQQQGDRPAAAPAAAGAAAEPVAKPGGKRKRKDAPPSAAAAAAAVGAVSPDAPKRAANGAGAAAGGAGANGGGSGEAGGGGEAATRDEKRKRRAARFKEGLVAKPNKAAKPKTAA